MFNSIKKAILNAFFSKKIEGLPVAQPFVGPTDRGLEWLLQNPTETLENEYKSWLDLKSDADHRAKLAKAVIAITNHGGGFVVLGWKEEKSKKKLIPDTKRPKNKDWEQYSPDNITGYINKFAKPAIQCKIYHIMRPDDGLDYIIIEVPKDFIMPVRTKNNGPNPKPGKKRIIDKNCFYIRSPRPETIEADDAQIDNLFEQCFKSRMKKNV